LKPNTVTTFSVASASAEIEPRTLAVRTALLVLRGYKLLLSPLFAGSCRFVPSCADYAREAVAHHGVARGGWLALKRVARCHPLCEGGYDPVPRMHFERLDVTRAVSQRNNS
jgi:putative membrane protein insertion efficiency factor